VAGAATAAVMDALQGHAARTMTATSLDAAKEARAVEMHVELLATNAATLAFSVTRLVTNTP